jgi:hypothetical protein
LILLVPVSLCFGQEQPSLNTADYQIFSPFYEAPSTVGGHLRYRYAWTNFEPYRMAVQFINEGTQDESVRFAIRDSNYEQNLLLDEGHNLYFATETLKAHSEGKVWSGAVRNYKDSFSLKLWTPQGEAQDQEPVSVLEKWVVRSRFTFTPTIDMTRGTPTFTQTPTFTMTPTITRTPTAPGPKYTPPNTATATLTATSTTTETATYSTTPGPKPASKVDSVYLVVGDSYAMGEGSDGPEGCFKQQTMDAMQKWYPGTVPYLFARSGTEPFIWAQPGGIVDALKIVHDEKKLPIGYMLLETGPMCFYCPNIVYDDDCHNSSLSEGVSYSFNYQKNMDAIFKEIYADSPDVNLVVMTIPDSSGGNGHYAPSGVYEAYHQRLLELKVKYPRIRIADAYEATLGHSEYFHHNDDNKDHPNHWGQDIITARILEQFANWPYRPGKHPETK